MARRGNSDNDQVYKADIMAYQGMYNQAAELYCQAGQSQTAVEMYLDLRQWDKAKRLVERLNKQGTQYVDDRCGSVIAHLDATVRA